MDAKKVGSTWGSIQYLPICFICLSLCAMPSSGANDDLKPMDHERMNMADKMPHKIPSTQEQPIAANPVRMDPREVHMQGGAAPPDARDPHANSGGYALDSGPYALPGPRQLRLADEHTVAGLWVDHLEYVDTQDGHQTAYDAQAWYGRYYNRLVLTSEGDIENGRLQDASTELLWGHAIAAFWDTKIGVRYDKDNGLNRRFLAFGVQGLAPFWIEMDVTAYLGENRRTALRLEAEYMWLLTQQLILQSQLETNLYGKSDPARGLASGWSDLTVGLRLRYEIRREFAPYIGIEWARKVGKIDDMVVATVPDKNEIYALAGVRFWY